MKQNKELTNKASTTEQGSQKDNFVATGGLRMRTDLRAGLAWDDLDDQAQQLWGNLTSAFSSLTGNSAQ